MEILILSYWFPYPPDNGARMRAFNLIKRLSAHNKIDLLSFAFVPPSENQIQEMKKYCRQVEVMQLEEFKPSRLRALLGYFSPLPRSVVDTYSKSLEKLIHVYTQKNDYDLMIALTLGTAPYAIKVRNKPKILEEVELGVYYEQQLTESLPFRKIQKQLMWEKYSRYVIRLLKSYDGCTVVSQKERGFVQKLMGDQYPISVVPNGVDISYYRDINLEPVPNTLIYSGALTYGANFDAVDYFLREIFPLIQATIPGVKLYITGSTENVPLEHLPKRDGVVFTGYLDDIRHKIAESWVNVVPLRIGGGTRLKILESLALGTPVVTTSKGVEGLELEHGRDLFIADEPKDFARVVISLLEDEEKRKELGTHGKHTVLAKYDWEPIVNRLEEFMLDILQKHADPSL